MNFPMTTVTTTKLSRHRPSKHAPFICVQEQSTRGHGASRACTLLRRCLSATRLQAAGRDTSFPKALRPNLLGEAEGKADPRSAAPATWVRSPTCPSPAGFPRPGGCPSLGISSSQTRALTAPVAPGPAMNRRIWQTVVFSNHPLTRTRSHKCDILGTEGNSQISISYLGRMERRQSVVGKRAKRKRSYLWLGDGSAGFWSKRAKLELRPGAPVPPTPVLPGLFPGLPALPAHGNHLRSFQKRSGCLGPAPRDP